MLRVQTPFLLAIVLFLPTERQQLVSKDNQVNLLEIFLTKKGKVYAVYIAGEWEDKGIVKASVFSAFFNTIDSF